MRPITLLTIIALSFASGCSHLQEPYPATTIQVVPLSEIPPNILAATLNENPTQIIREVRLRKSHNPNASFSHYYLLRSAATPPIVVYTKNGQRIPQKDIIPNLFNSPTN